MTKAHGRAETPLYMAHIVPGLSHLAWEEIAERAPSARCIDAWSGIDRRADAMLFRSGAPAASLLELRLTEDVFAVVGLERRLLQTRAGLRAITNLARLADGLDTALRLHREARSPKLRAHPRYRIVARTSGVHAFRRIDAQRACEAGLAQRLPRWRLVDDDDALEFWLQVIGETAILALRLSPASMRQRTYRESSLPGALKPTVAQALVRLARVRRGGLLVDPACGTGTVLAEATSAGLRALGGDVDQRAVRAARQNAGIAIVASWDAGRLPLRDGAVDGVASNLPWGKTHSSGDMAQLYRRCLEEAHRVVKSRGRVALLVSEPRLVERPSRGSFTVEHRLQVTVRGADAWLLALRKQDRSRH